MRWLGIGGVLLVLLLLVWAFRDDPAAHRTSERARAAPDVAKRPAATGEPGAAAEPAAAAPAPKKKRKFDVEIALRWANGKPAQGIRVELTRGGLHYAHGFTDADGMVRFLVTPKRLWVFATFGEEHPEMRRAIRHQTLIGKVRGKDVRIEHVFPVLRDLVVRVQAPGGWPEGARVESPPLIDAKTHPEAGEIRGRFAAGDEVEVKVVAGAFAPGLAKVAVPPTGPVLVDVELGVSVTVAIHHTGFKGGVLPYYLEGAPNPTVLGVNHTTWRVGPGRYPVRLRGSNLLLHTVEARRAPVRVDLDLHAVRELDVEFEIPDGFDPDWLRVRIDGKETWESRMFVPGDRVLKFSGVHPLLRPADDGGIVETRDGGTITLRMVARPLLRFALPFEPKGQVQVWFAADRPAAATPHAGGWACPWTPGTYDLTIQVRGYLPYPVPRARITADGLDLGTIVPTRAGRGR